LETRELTFQHQGELKTFADESELDKRKSHLEYKLVAEQIVVAETKSDQELKKYVEEHQAKTSWRAWMPSVLTTNYWSKPAPEQESRKQEDPQEVEF